MKKLSIMISLSLLLLLFVNAASYKSADFFYTLKLPDGWTESDASDTSQIIFSNTEEDAAVVIGVFAREPGVSSEDLLQAVISRMRLKGTKKAITYKGYPATAGTFRFTMNNAKLVADIVIFNTETCFFMIMGSSLKDTYDKNKDALEAIFSSFALDGKALDTAYGAVEKGKKNTSDTGGKKTTVIEDNRGQYYTIRINWGDLGDEFPFIEPDYYVAVEEGREIIASGNLWAYYDVDPSTDPKYTKTFWSRFFQDMYNRNYLRVSTMVEWFKAKAAEKHWSAYELATNVIKCVQAIPYERPYQVISDQTQAAAVLDYFTPNEIAWYNKGDCDTKSMLIVMILRQLGYDAVLYFSEYYAHAMAGLSINASGTFKVSDGKKFYFVESTYPGWNIGDLPPEFGDPAKWYLVMIE